MFYHPHPLLSPSFISSFSFIIFILYRPHALSSSSFILILYHPYLYHPRPLSSSSCIVRILYHLHPLLSSSSIILVLYYLYLSLSSSLSMYHRQIHPYFYLQYLQPYRSYRLMSLLTCILLLVTNIKQDAPRRESNLGIFLRAFSKGPGRPTTPHPPNKISRLGQFQERCPQCAENSAGQKNLPSRGRSGIVASPILALEHLPQLAGSKFWVFLINPPEIRRALASPLQTPFG